MTIKVDLLPTERKRFGFDPVLGFLLVIVLVFTAGFWFYGNSLNNTIETKKAAVLDKENKIKEMESKIPIIEDLKKKNAELEQQIKAVKELVYDPIRYANLLQEVANVMPRNIWISNLNIEPSSTTVSFNATAIGMGNNRPLESIAQLMKNIQGSKILNTPTLSSASQTGEKGSAISYGFQIEAKYDPEAAAGLNASKEGE